MVDCHGPGMVTPTIQSTMPATVYVRWSSEAQTGRDSLRRQLESAQRYADEHRLLIVETIIDEAVSAFSGDHLTKGRLGEFIRRVEDRAVAGRGSWRDE
jgi:DNA invertase Pin-like site-specific DNA recombinase